MKLIGAADARRGRVVGIAGAKGSPGCTFVAVGLARCLADAGLPVLLVDADAEEPGVAAALALPAGRTADLGRVTSLGVDPDALDEASSDAGGGLRVLELAGQGPFGAVGALPVDGVELWRSIFGAVTPLGPLADHLTDPDIEEVRINGTSSCYVLKEGRRFAVPPPFADEARLVELVHWYTDGSGARLDRASPTVTLTLPDGSRLHAALSPPARPLSVTIRRHPVSRFRTLGDLAASGFMPAELGRLLEAAVLGRLNILVAGGTGTGKTTFMRVLCRLIPAEERVVTIEDQAELHLWGELPDCISLEGRPANIEGQGAISIQMLVTEALRMSPDRIVIGEVRGGEALDLLDAMNTGHPGSVCTLHAETPRETLPRLARLALRNPHAPRPEAVVGEVVRTVDLVLHLGVSTEGGVRRRRLASVGYVAGAEAGQPIVDELVRLEPDGRWRRVGSPRAMPERSLLKLQRVGDPDRLLEGIDA